MTARMSMRERREKIETLVQNNPRVQACAREFDESLETITDWHARNDALCATKAELYALADMIAYSEFCLEDLKCAKTAAYNQLMSQYPRVWDTTCADPFYTTMQTTAPEAGAEREETANLPETEGMSPVPEPDMFTIPPVATLHVTSCNPALRDWIMRLDHDTTPSDSPDHLTAAAHAEHTQHHDMPVDASQYIPVAVVKSILTKWETHYKGFRDFLAGRGLNPDGAGCAIFAIKEIRDDINKLTTTEEAPNA